MPGFQIRMGFGLHVGWAIEGAIGSVYKIDASYLSPHVNMAARLEAATKQACRQRCCRRCAAAIRPQGPCGRQRWLGGRRPAGDGRTSRVPLSTQYGVSMLLSEDFVRLLSPGVRQRVRQIDCVTVKGSRQPIGLYTYDMSVDGLEILSGITSTQSKACRAAALAACGQAVLPPVLPQPPSCVGHSRRQPPVPSWCAGHSRAWRRDLKAADRSVGDLFSEPVQGRVQRAPRHRDEQLRGPGVPGALLLRWGGTPASTWLPLLPTTAAVRMLACTCGRLLSFVRCVCRVPSVSLRRLAAGGRHSARVPDGAPEQARLEPGG